MTKKQIDLIDSLCSKYADLSELRIEHDKGENYEDNCNCREKNQIREEIEEIKNKLLSA